MIINYNLRLGSTHPGKRRIVITMPVETQKMNVIYSLILNHILKELAKKVFTIHFFDVCSSASKRFESESAPSQAKKRQNAPQFFFQKNATIFT